MAVIVPAVLAAAYGVYQIAESDKKSREAERLAKANKRPVYNINEGEKSNLALAESRAQQGLSAASRQYYNTNAQQGLSKSIEAILKGGGDVNSISSVNQGYLDNLSRITLLDDQQQLQNIDRLIQERRRMTDQMDNAFKINEYAPFADTAASIYQMKNAANNERAAGIGGVIQGVGGVAMGAQQNNQRNDLMYGNGQPARLPASGYNGGTYATSGDGTVYGTPDYMQGGYFSPYPQQSSAGNNIPTGFDINYWNTLSAEDRNMLMGLYGYK